jgi:hypothetical protein
MAGKIFINYRRGDDAGHTGRLFDRLQDIFPRQQLFLDVDNIAPGLDFVRVLNDRVAECDVVLTVIGKGWLDARDASGKRRLDDPDDFVRIEIASALNQDKLVIPVLVNDASMPRPEDLPEVLRPLARRNAVRLTHERFRSDTQGLIKALQQSLGEIAVQRHETEAARAAAERRREQAVAKQRSAEERALAAAKHAGTVLALDAFLLAYPDGLFADEAHRLKGMLVAREDAYQRAAASTDPAVLESFIATYHSGADVTQVRRQLRRVGAQRGRRLPAVAVASALAVVVIAAAALYWFETRRPPPQPAMTAPAAAPAPAPPAETHANVPLPVPRPDQAAWDLLKDTTDQAALKRFIAEYPSSPLRKDAEARLAALAAADAAKPALLPPDQIAWAIVKDSKDPEELRRFIDQFPQSSERADAEMRIAALAAEAAQAEAASEKELTRALQVELTRVGCFNGDVNGQFDDATKAALQSFMKLTSLNLPDEVSPDALKAIRGVNKRVCPLQCAADQHADGDRCVANPPPAPKRVETAPARPPSHPAARGSGRCFSFQGQQFCE